MVLQYDLCEEFVYRLPGLMQKNVIPAPIFSRNITFGAYDKKLFRFTPFLIHFPRDLHLL